MADHRTRRQKVEALLRGAQTEGERAAAQAALDRMKDKEPEEVSGDSYARAGYQPPTGDQARPAGYQTRGSFDPYARSWSSSNQAWEAFSRSFSFSFGPQESLNELRQRQAEERLRRSGFTMPGDAGFESEFTKSAADFNEGLKKAGEEVDRLKEAIEREYVRGNIDWATLIQRMKEAERGSTE